MRSVGVMEVQVQMCSSLLIFIMSVAALINGIEMEPSSSHLVPCKKGWYLFGERCYKVFGKKDPRSWTEAKETCYGLDGQLVTIESKEVQDFLTSFLVLNERVDAWIGLQKDDTKWINGIPVNYTHWVPPEGRDERFFRIGDCAHMVFSDEALTSMWRNVPCGDKLPFICQMNKTEQEENPDPRFCSLEKGGGFKFMNSCYHVIAKEESWEDAEEYCQSHFSGHLVTILNFETGRFLKYITSDFLQNTWIGAKVQDRDLQIWSSGWHVGFNKWVDEQDLIKGYCGLKTRSNYWITDNCEKEYPFICETSDKSKFQWTDGSEINYQNWKTGEPNDITEECGEIYTNFMKWNDVPCNAKKGYICSAKKLPPIFYEENTPTTNFARAEYQKSDDAAKENAFIIVISILIIVIFIGTVTFFIKFYWPKNIKFSFPLEFSRLLTSN